MGIQKRLTSSRKPAAGSKPLKGENFYHGKRFIKQKQIWDSKPIRDKRGRIVRDAPFQKSKADPVVRVEPHRKWFNATRTIGQRELELFRSTMEEAVSNPWKVIVNRRQLPTSLLTNKRNEAISEDGSIRKIGKMLLQNETFEHATHRRKRPRIDHLTMEELAKSAAERAAEYENGGPKESAYGIAAFNTPSEEYIAKSSMDPKLNKGLSKRIWNELYKVIDSSDVVVHVLDVRNPIGTQCLHIEQFIHEKGPHKHLVYVLNKCDLVPPWVTEKWLKYFTRQRPTLAFQASLDRPFGKGALIQLLRRFAVLHKEKQQISVGFVGYPNVGKSSIINTLRRKTVCKVAPIPGETKVWQYISLTRRIYLVDCPGVVYPGDDAESIVTKGVVRVESLKDRTDYIPVILRRLSVSVIERHFGVKQEYANQWKEDADAFLEAIGKRYGMLGKGGEIKVDLAAAKVLHEWNRGRLPYFELPPRSADEDEKAAKVEAKEEGNCSATGAITASAFAATGERPENKRTLHEVLGIKLPTTVEGIQAMDAKNLDEEDADEDAKTEQESDGEITLQGSLPSGLDHRDDSDDVKPLPNVPRGAQNTTGLELADAEKDVDRAPKLITAGEAAEIEARRQKEESSSRIRPSRVAGFIVEDF